ncbi:YajQ family cyclic di-GMP-binding protein [Bdellovibrio bacteriovorus]|uniref:Nucleotide-binding protein Bdt_0334 n=1 Tax=Bdellovibrio bacteriovorus str. Tiberius TaxID=1069642 RepID=K7ZE07_BDEBC|nr:YajQ family cyclic di-GMP-binding protein [Bdellovibrio bacteriovorus]AFY00042.1 putative nucleotide-binding protein [Bdellovibrio bacteriovorus str. Tiberius]
MPSFDIVSEIDVQEVDNAVNQARKEIEARYDFKGSKAELQWDKKEMVLMAEDEYKVGAMASILQTKLHRRGIDIKAIKFEKIEEAGGRMLRQKVTLVQGIDREIAKDIIKLIKDSKLKVQPQVADDKLKVTSKSIDELQECISLVRGGNFPLPLQFNNMRA